MEHTDVLQTMAEVAAGFAGFTAILLAVLSRDTSLLALRIGIIHFLQLSLGVVLLALIPSVLASLTDNVDAIWRLSNGIQGVYHLYLLWWILSKKHLSVGHSQMGPGLTGFLALCGFGIALTNLCVAAGLFSELAAFAFLFGLLWYLGMALVNFVGILLSRLNIQ